MFYFQCDYVAGCHPSILAKLSETNYEQTTGYGTDPYCESARARIKKACGNENADVHFLVGGTQTNTTVIASALKAYQGVISPDSGHIAVHETGAIEATGHKVLTLPSHDGMLDPKEVDEYITAHYASETAEHTVQPGMVYISFPTESGTLYSKKHLTELKKVCDKHSIPLFIDGARMGYGITSPACDITLAELTALCDVFYIGGTKCGALFGEAVVITNDALKRDFRYMIKQRGGMLAKGRLLGIQFDELMKNDLYFEICGNAVKYALKIRDAFIKKGIKMFGSSMTNQQFPILSKAQSEYFAKDFVYEVWGKDNGKEIVRFCTSWATVEDEVDALISAIEAMPE